MSKPAPAPESFLEDGVLTAAAWTAALHDGLLLGQRCPTCNHVTAAPKAACARCGTRELIAEVLPSDGEVYSETTIEVPPEGFPGRYRVAIVDLGEARVLGRIPDDAGIGDVVSLAGVVAVDDRAAPRFG